MALPAGGGVYTGSAITKTNANVFIADLWSDEIKIARDSKMVMSNTMKRINFVGRKGDVLHIPNVGRLAVYDKLPETPVTLQARTETEYTITIDKYKEASFMVEDIVKLQAAYDSMSIYTKQAGYALARDMDNFCLGLRAAIYNIASQRVNVTSGGNGAPIDLAAILAAKQLLDDADAPEEGRKLIVSPAQYNDLLTIPEFTSKDFQAAMPVASGVVGSLYGIEVWKSTQVTANSATGYVNGDGAEGQPTPGVTGSPYLPTQDGTITTFLPTALGTSTTVYSAIMCHSDWAALAVQLNPDVEKERSATYKSDICVNTQLYGAKVYRPDHAVIITSAA